MDPYNRLGFSVDPYNGHGFSMDPYNGHGSSVDPPKHVDVGTVIGNGSQSRQWPSV